MKALVLKRKSLYKFKSTVHNKVSTIESSTTRGLAVVLLHTAKAPSHSNIRVSPPELTAHVYDKRSHIKFKFVNSAML